MTRLHSPSSRAIKWGFTGRAFIGDNIRNNPSFSLLTSRTDGRHETAVSRLNARPLPGPGPGGSFILKWLVDSYQGRDFEIRSGDTVTIAGGTASLSDVITLGSEVRLGVLHGDTVIHTVALGELIGLTIVSAQVDYPVWVPSD